MSIEEVINRAVQLGQTIEIEYCTRAGKGLLVRYQTSGILNTMVENILRRTA